MTTGSPPERTALETARAREHLANERTLLAWIRTALALMGMGFVVARFGLFLRQLGVEASRTAPVAPGFSTAIGVGLILARWPPRLHPRDDSLSARTPSDRVGSV